MPKSIIKPRQGIFLKIEEVFQSLFMNDNLDIPLEVIVKEKVNELSTPPELPSSQVALLDTETGSYQHEFLVRGTYRKTPKKPAFQSITDRSNSVYVQPLVNDYVLALQEGLDRAVYNLEIEEGKKGSILVVRSKAMRKEIEAAIGAYMSLVNPRGGWLTAQQFMDLTGAFGIDLRSTFVGEEGHTEEAMFTPQHVIMYSDRYYKRTGPRRIPGGKVTDSDFRRDANMMKIYNKVLALSRDVGNTEPNQNSM